jgi:hypothetical protein
VSGWRGEKEAEETAGGEEARDIWALSEFGPDYADHDVQAMDTFFFFEREREQLWTVDLFASSYYTIITVVQIICIDATFDVVAVC